MADTTTELEVLNQIVDVLGGTSGQYETVVPTLQQILALLGGGGGSGSGYNPAASVGRADALTGADSTAQWAQRVTEGSGSATVRSVQGAAVAWNQMLPELTASNFTPSATTSVSFADGVAACTVNANYASIFRSQNYVGGHKYMQTADIKSPSGYIVNLKYQLNDAVISIGAYTAGTDKYERVAAIFTPPASSESGYNRVLIQGQEQSGFTYYVKNWQLFDLTAMFGSGNEPSTVAEFEQMYPASYYPYSAPTLKPVQIAGIQSKDAQGGELDSVEWETFTLRGAGAIGDMLYSDHVDVRMGVVDLGTLEWEWFSSLSVFLSNKITDRLLSVSTAGVCATYGVALVTSSSAQITAAPDKTLMFSQSNINIFVKDSTYGSDVAAFKASLSGVMCFYTIATPTTQPISPALPMTYRVEQGGSETIIVPEGEISAIPVLTIAEGESAADVVMDALACIAAPDGPIATANHSAGTYLTMQGKLYKVTSAIAVGETIVAGTNVTQTTVMAELIALTQ